MVWPRPIPTTGDSTSSAERASDPRAWALPAADADALYRIIACRRDVRRFRPDPVEPGVLHRVLGAAHAAPSVGHSQPWRFVLVREAETRWRAALVADRERLRQAAAMDDVSGRHLLDLDLEGIREAPLGVVVCCDRRAPPEGILGRATFVDADVWSCVCAIENLWLAARAEGLGVGWVTLFDPDELAGIVGAPEGVTPLGWFCLGWPDERPPAPGLERRGWSSRLPLEEVVMEERWPSDGPSPPRSHLRPPEPAAVVAAHDRADQILTAPSSLGLLDKLVDRLVALGFSPPAAGAGAGGTLVIAASDHPVAHLGVSAYRRSVSRHVTEAAVEGQAVGAVAATTSGLDLVVVDAGVDGPPVRGARVMRPGGHRGDLVSADGLTPTDVEGLVSAGRELGDALARSSAGPRVVALGEVGVGNTTVAAAMAALLLDADPASVAGLGAGADSAILATKRSVVQAAVQRARLERATAGVGGAWWPLAACGGPEIAVLAGVVLGAAARATAVILDGLATSVAALLAVQVEPTVAAHLVAGQRSREAAHPMVLEALGLEPLLDLRLRAGEGAGAALAWAVLRAGLEIRFRAARTAVVERQPGGGSAGGPTPR